MRADPRCFLSTVTGNRQQHKVRERFAAKDNDDGHLAFDQLGRFSIPPEAGFPPKGKFILKVYQVTEQEQQGEGQTTGGGGGGGGGGQKLVGTQLSQLPLDDHRGLIFGSEFENITEDNLILDRGQGVHNQHVAIWYSTQRQRMMIQSINGTTTIHSITRAAHTLINSDKYLLSNKTPNTLKLQITPLDGKKAFTADKCLFTISTPPQGSQQQQTNSKDKKQQQQQQPMKLYFVEGPHCGPDRRTAERLQQQQQQERQARDRAREDDRPGGGTTTGGHYRGSRDRMVVVVLVTGYVVNLEMTLSGGVGGGRGGYVNNTYKMHPRNRHIKPVDYKELSIKTGCEELAQYVYHNRFGGYSINYNNRNAVKCLTKCILLHLYNIKGWTVPDGCLIPPVPTRENYIHHLADLIHPQQQQQQQSSSECYRDTSVKGIDVGIGGNGIYSLLGSALYGWQMFGTEVSQESIDNVQSIIDNNKDIVNITIKKQEDKMKIFEGCIVLEDTYTFSMCNPPFYENDDNNKDAMMNRNPYKDYGGSTVEMRCQGGELGFLT
ncbi:hypothetical protein FOZ61_000654, partial [Perkinsus olseni]